MGLLAVVEGAEWGGRKGTEMGFKKDPGSFSIHCGDELQGEPLIDGTLKMQAVPKQQAIIEDLEGEILIFDRAMDEVDPAQSATAKGVDLPMCNQQPPRRGSHTPLPLSRISSLLTSNRTSFLSAPLTSLALDLSAALSPCPCGAPPLPRTSP
ncbi:unnamed protein product [Chondrus crispus]|uniref:Uncharacterized protein n=1 Tax=Chondrus crispus TaxID=2769 RepID=R7Q5T6_CHOCR|nr:unnamed protein product [Chondrus crispus]CDF33379.1 unnamed protein product [Chondrus crispus]|eukprot:XP_005713182.1 unnamed protein product [Chondrus crispus]